MPASDSTSLFIDAGEFSAAALVVSAVEDSYAVTTAHKFTLPLGAPEPVVQWLKTQDASIAGSLLRVRGRSVTLHPGGAPASSSDLVDHLALVDGRAWEGQGPCLAIRQPVAGHQPLAGKLGPVRTGGVVMQPAMAAEVRGLVRLLRRRKAPAGVLVWDLGRELSHLVYVGKEGVAQVVAVSAAFQVVQAVIQQKVNLLTTGAAARLFFGEAFDFTDMADAIAAPLAEAFLPSLEAYRKAHGVSPAWFTPGLPPHTRWLERAVAKRLGLEPLGVTTVDLLPAGLLVDASVELDAGLTLGLLELVGQVFPLAAAEPEPVKPKSVPAAVVAKPAPVAEEPVRKPVVVPEPEPVPAPELTRAEVAPSVAFEPELVAPEKPGAGGPAVDAAPAAEAPVEAPVPEPSSNAGTDPAQVAANVPLPAAATQRPAVRPSGPAPILAPPNKRMTRAQRRAAYLAQRSKTGGGGAADAASFDEAERAAEANEPAGGVEAAPEPSIAAAAAGEPLRADAAEPASRGGSGLKLRPVPPPRPPPMQPGAPPPEPVVRKRGLPVLWLLAAAALLIGAAWLVGRLQ